ncbi:MAG: ABC transporter ATP-binding protein [Thermodesulfobacteriota bacterium]|nr:ABC transporter ATP-binding protein [Thermodesulfobacteriota bacterium]
MNSVGKILKIEGLTKDFSNIRVLDDINLTVSVDKPRVSIIGPNGAGKTTLLNIISGEILPSQGKIWLFGQNVTHMPPNKLVHLGIGRIFQVADLFFNLTLLDNVILSAQAKEHFRFNPFRGNGVYHKLLPDIEHLLIQMDLWEKKDELVGNLPHGDIRKTELVLALASKPKILFLDEPTAGLTIAEARKFTELIKNLPRQIPLIMIEHHMDIVMTLSDQIIVLNSGIIIAKGNPEEIKENPQVREIYLGGGQKDP